MPNYQNGKIYKLCTDLSDKVYVGSTCLRLSQRKASHKGTSKRSNSRVYQYINSIGWQNVRIVLLEKYPCNDKDELRSREEYYRKQLNAVLNSNGCVDDCPHNRQKSRCKECGGTSICEHNRQKSKCKDCGGASICEHNRQKSTCKECGGASLCVHNRRKSTCKECNPMKCNICNQIYSKGTIRGHRKTKIHKKRYQVFQTEYEQLMQRSKDLDNWSYNKYCAF